MPCKRSYEWRSIKHRAGTKAYNKAYYEKVTKPKRRRER